MNIGEFRDLALQVTESQPYPVLCEFIPFGRTAQDVAIYKVMRRLARCNRRLLWERTNQAIANMLLYGSSTSTW